MYVQDKEFLDTLNSSGIRQHFHRTMNIPTIKEIFHCLDSEVDLDDILHSPASQLYCTFYCNMCEYVLKYRVRPGDQRRKIDDERLYANFRLIAHEDCFEDLLVEDIPRRPRKPANKKRLPPSKVLPLSQSDSSFKIFNPPSTYKPRPGKRALARSQQRIGEGS